MTSLLMKTSLTMVCSVLDVTQYTYVCPLGLSTHEKRLAALQQQIAALEAENVSKKDWTLMGEATSRIRPHDSLLEEDLEFERVMKAVPVITEEVVSGLEDRIKARILEGRFDDVVRKRPVDDKPFLQSRFFELQDTKSKQSLAQIYEDEYTAVQTGGVAGEDRDGKLKAEHEEIIKTWEAVSSKLDALSNAHFTPKAVSIRNTSARRVVTLLSAHCDYFDYYKRCIDQLRVCSAHYQFSG
jgi:U3 small nucleolar RNA-associated protein MPP10